MRPRPPISVFDRALNLIAVRDRAEGELRQRLKRHEYSSEEIDRAIERLRALGYLDDARFAKGRAEALARSGRYGPRAIALKIQAAGIASGQARLVTSEALSPEEEAERARLLIRQRHPAAPGSNDPKVRARAFRFLLGRGFSPRAITAALGRGSETEDEI